VDCDTYTDTLFSLPARVITKPSPDSKGRTVETAEFKPFPVRAGQGMIGIVHCDSCKRKYEVSVGDHVDFPFDAGVFVAFFDGMRLIVRCKEVCTWR